MQTITEEMGIQKEWAKECDEMTLEKLPEFIRKLTQDYQHDYGTICHAIACGAIATAKAIDRSPAGGITGFQAGCIQWQMIKLWGIFDKGPLRMVQYNKMLYPQYESIFQKTISQSTWDYLQKEAKENLGKAFFGSVEVKAHWESIAAGKVPFGYSIKEDND